MFLVSEGLSYFLNDLLKMHLAHFCGCKSLVFLDEYFFLKD